MGAGFDDAARTFSTSHLDGYFTYLLTNMGVPSPYNSVFAPWAYQQCHGHTLQATKLPWARLWRRWLHSPHSVPGLCSKCTGLVLDGRGIPDNNVTLNMATGARNNEFDFYPKISDSYLPDIFRIFMNVYFLMVVRITIPLSLLILPWYVLWLVLREIELIFGGIQDIFSLHIV